MDTTEKLKQARDLLRSTADIIDEILVLDEREKKGENVSKELEAALGRFMLKMIEIGALTI